MNKYWGQIVIAAVFEVAWVIGLKHANEIIEWIGTAIAVFISFYLLIRSSRFLPAGTVYAVFVGLGTTGTVIAEFLFFNKEIELSQIVLIGLLLIGVMGLKFVSNTKPSMKGDET